MNGSDFVDLVRMSVPHLNKPLERAVAYRAEILKRNSGNDAIVDDSPSKDTYPFGEGAKMVRRHKLKSKHLTPTEQDEVVVKYESGMTMTAIANQYGCHYTTIGTLLRKRGVKIRPK